MDILKNVWFFSFKVDKNNVSTFVVNIIAYVVAACLAGIILWLASMLTGWIVIIGPLFGFLLGLIGGAIELYCLIGIVLSVLVFIDVLKD